MNTSLWRRVGTWAAVSVLFVTLGLVTSWRGASAQPAPPAPSGDRPMLADEVRPAPTTVPPATSSPSLTAPAPKGDAAVCVDAPSTGGGPSKLVVTSKRKPKPIYEELIPIALLVAVIILVIARLPKVAIDHSPAFRRRRVLNWLPLGLTYAFLYMARYNITVLKDAGALSGSDYGDINFWGALTYGIAFLINGPLTDRWGGRTTILIAAAGSLATNVLMGVLIATGNTGDLKLTLSLLFSLNMYFQSFGAVSIVKVNAGWFHLRERGTFGGIFGILISLGIYFAFDWGFRIAVTLPESPEALFFIPAGILVVFFVLCFLYVRDNPSDAGFADFDPGDASSGQSNEREPAFRVMKRLLTNKIILIIAVIEFSSGFLRQAILQWYRDFAKGVGGTDSFVYENWGLVSCVAGITGGVFAGLISDHLFQSRRAPMSAVLYAVMLGGAIVVLMFIGMPVVVSWTIAVMAMAIIGVHGMLSGTASQDFGGKKNAGIAVGIIDGFVYLGNAFQSQVYGRTLPEKGSCAAKDLDNWLAWPIWMIPLAVLGFVLGIVVWNARPDKPKPR